MKKATKIFSVITLCIMMVVLSITPAFAEDSSMVEDHSVVDCTHYYKDNGNYYFQIKCLKGEFEKVTVLFTNSDNGYGCGTVVSFKHSSFTGIFNKEYSYSDDKYEYVWLIVKCSEYPDSYISSFGGLGIKIYYFDDNGDKMATNTSNGSTEQGRGYWLSA